MFIPGLPKGLQIKLSQKLEESFDMYVDKVIKLYEDSQSVEDFSSWWLRYKTEKATLKKGGKK